MELILTYRRASLSELINTYPANIRLAVPRTLRSILSVLIENPFSSPPELSLACSEAQGDDASDQQNDTDSRGQFLAALSLDSDLGISNLHTMVLTVWYGHDKSQQSEYQQQDTDEANALHIRSSCKIAEPRSAALNPDWTASLSG